MQRLHEEWPLLAIIAAQTINNTPKTSSWVHVGQMHELFAELVLGDMAAETIDFKIEQATDSSGTGVADLKASTQLAAHAANNDSKVLQIHVDTAQMDDGFAYARIRAVTGNTSGGPGAATLRGRSRYQPGTQAAAVVETATL